MTTFPTHESATEHLRKQGFRQYSETVFVRGEYRAYVNWYRDGSGKGYLVQYWPEQPSDMAHQSLRERLGARAYQ